MSDNGEFKHEITRVLAVYHDCPEAVVDRLVEVFEEKSQHLYSQLEDNQDVDEQLESVSDERDRLAKRVRTLEQQIEDLTAPVRVSDMKNGTTRIVKFTLAKKRLIFEPVEDEDGFV